MAAGPGGDVPVDVLKGWFDRLVGLLGTRRGGTGARVVALVGCSSIHTFGMRYAIDVALVSREGVVMRAARGVMPSRVIGAHGAWLALERPSSTGPWPGEGQRVEVSDGGGAALVGRARGGGGGRCRLPRARSGTQSDGWMGRRAR